MWNARELCRDSETSDWRFPFSSQQKKREQSRKCGVESICDYSEFVLKHKSRFWTLSEFIDIQVLINNQNQSWSKRRKSHDTAEKQIKVAVKDFSQHPSSFSSLLIFVSRWISRTTFSSIFNLFTLFHSGNTQVIKDISSIIRFYLLPFFCYIPATAQNFFPALKVVCCTSYTLSNDKTTTSNGHGMFVVFSSFNPACPVTKSISFAFFDKQKNIERRQRFTLNWGQKFGTWKGRLTR